MPAASSTNCDAEEFRDMVSSLIGEDFVCRCHASRRRGRRNLAMGTFDFFLDITAEEHLPNCPVALSTGASQDRKVGLRYTGLRRLLNTAVQLSFFWTSGAGGRSFGPSFTYYPTVDRETAPVFRILRLIRFCSGKRVLRLSSELVADSSVTLTDFKKLTALALAKIVKLFQARKASPLAVDSFNQSLAHKAAAAVGCLGINHATRMLT